MPRLMLALLLFLGALAPARAAGMAPLERAAQGLGHVWEAGRPDLYLPLHTHHLRYAYDRERIDGYQEDPPGFGFGRSLEEDGQWRGLYGMAFQDSHFKPSYILGYGHRWLWQPAEHWRVGGGLTAFLMARSDIGHYLPFPGVLPTASLAYRAVSVETAFVPGSRGAGNILFFWARIELDRQ